MSTELDVDAIRARLEKATPGPWSQGMVGDKLIPEVDYSAAFGWIVVDGDRGDDGNGGLNDADFISNAPDDIAALLAALDEAVGLLRRAFPVVDYHAHAGDLTACRVIEEYATFLARFDGGQTDESAR